MPIDYSKLRNITARELINGLTHDGFLHTRTKGSHRRYRHSDGRGVTVSCHALSDTFPPKTLRSIIEGQARWTEADVQRLGLIK
ncbi:MAG: type II toxin-antitoxin system HicA family toxin [Acidobacteriota bacterium]